MPRKYPLEARQKAVQRVLDGLACGTPLAVICRSEGFPNEDTIRMWAQGDEELARSIARARESGHDHIALEALAIADDRSDDPASRRVRVETRLKLLAKWDPKRYGDTTTTKHEGGLTLNVVTGVPRD